jgi:hypothetical protein
MAEPPRSRRGGVSVRRVRPNQEGAAVAVNDVARKTHEQLFPGHVSTLAVTDPELIEYFDNFAFDEAGGSPPPVIDNNTLPRTAH